MLQIDSNQRPDSRCCLLNLEEQILTRVFCGEHQKVAIVPFDPFGGQPPKLSAQGRDVPVLNFLWQAEELEGQHQVVSPQQHLHIGSVGQEAAGGDLGHGIGALELPQQKLLKSPVAVKTPHRWRSQSQIGDERPMVGVALESEEPLLDLFCFQRYGPAHGHKPVLLLPLQGSVEELSRFPAVSELLVSSFDHAGFQRSRHAGDNDVAQPLFVEGLDDVFVVESSIESDPSARGRHRGREFVQDQTQKIPGSRGGVDIASSQLHAQTQTVARFAGDDRSVRNLAMASFGDVTHRRAFLRTVSDQRCGIGIHNSAVEQPQAQEQLLTRRS